MLGQPPPAYVDAYWDDVTDELRTAHHAPAHEIGPAIDAYRKHMAPAGQTIYNRSPASVARSVVAHGLLPSVPPVGLCVQLTFALTDPNAVLADPTLVAAKVSGLIDALSEYERTLGGAGLAVGGMEAYPGAVQLYLRPVQAAGARVRLVSVAEAVNHPTPSVPKVKQERGKGVQDMRFQNAALAVKQQAA